MQNDLLLELLTPREALRFSAKLRLEGVNIENRVENLIKQFGLDKCADNTISDLSTGERKRVAIAYEIITDPLLIIVDEPTSGLDSITSLKIMKYLKELASLGKTISI